MWHSFVDEEWNHPSITFRLAYLEATCYQGQNLTFKDLRLAWDGKPSPWLDAILAKVGKKMSDWEFYSYEDE